MTSPYIRGHLQRAPRPRDPEVDAIAVERACHGDPINLTIAERAEAIRRLARHGESARKIAERLRMTSRSVRRYKAGKIAHGEPRDER